MEQLATPIEEIVAGFIVWLARQRIEVDRRQRCPGLAREFLLWRRARRQQAQPFGLEPYLDDLRIKGVTFERGQVTDAVGLLERYLKECG